MIAAICCVPMPSRTSAQHHGWRQPDRGTSRSTQPGDRTTPDLPYEAKSGATVDPIADEAANSRAPAGALFLLQK
jgi:hypothetical protein